MAGVNGWQYLAVGAYKAAESSAKQTFLVDSPPLKSSTGGAFASDRPARSEAGRPIVQLLYPDCQCCEMLRPL